MIETIIILSLMVANAMIAFNIADKLKDSNKSIDEIKESHRLLEEYLKIEQLPFEIKNGELWGVPYFETELRYVKKNNKIKLEVTKKTGDSGTYNIK